MQRYAQFSFGDVQGVRTVYQCIESETDPDGINGEWVLCPAHVGPGFTSADGGVTYEAPVFVAPVVLQHATKQAFQNRFPLAANGVSTKWDLMTLFLNSDSYAASLGVTGTAMHELRLLITTGVNRLNASPYVDMSPEGKAAALTLLMMQSFVPVAFRLSAGERETMFDTPLDDSERYEG
jgi:hypothetical protein